MDKATINLDDLSIVETYDSGKMLETVQNLPDQCMEACALSHKIELSGFDTGNINNIVIQGMGGSSISGELIQSLLEDVLAVPVIINKKSELPAFVDKNSLVITISYSGNTQESLAGFNAALQKGAKLITISSGGRLKELAGENNIYNFSPPAGFMPRAAIAYLFFPLLNIFSKLGFAKIKDGDIDNLINLLKFLQKSWRFDIRTEQNMAKKLAHRFYEKIPVIYTNTEYLYKVALRWKTQINENAKGLAHINCFPELMHNEIVAYTKKLPIYNDLSVILLTDPADQETKQAVIFTKQIIQNNLPVLELSPFGNSKLEKMFSLIYLGDFISVYLAFLNHQDPTPIHLIDRFKSKK
ncbi:MAG: bifunctional phosphoglucose/phosphomannose isomerase [Armatimonadota bacterium]